MKNFTLMVVETFNNIVHVRLSDTEYVGNWENFSQEISFPFPDENIVSVNFEPDRNHYTIERPKGVVDSGEDIQEVAWIKENLELIRAASKKFVELEAVSLTGKDRRGQLLFETEWLVQRHIEQAALSMATTLSEQQFQELLAYRQALRDLTDTVDLNKPFDTIDWPIAPSFL
jgi:hypothetical protein